MDPETDIEPVVAELPVVCTLSTKAASGHALEWADLHHRATGVAAVDGGVRMTLPAAMFESVEDLARRESDCCAFLTISTSVTGDVLTLDISSANPEALPVMSALAGIALP